MGDCGLPVKVYVTESAHVNLVFQNVGNLGLNCHRLQLITGLVA